MDAKETITWLINFRNFIQGFGPENTMTNLANYCLVSRDTLYRWLNRKSSPKEIKAVLIEEWLTKRDPKREFLTSG